MPPPPSSDVQVFVRYKDQCVFAGEELICTITFKNVAELPEQIHTPSLPTPRQAKRNSISQVVAQQNVRGVAGRIQNARTSSTGAPGNGIDATQQPLNAQVTTPIPSMGVTQATGDNSRPGQKHQRSLSIMSINSPGLPEEGASRGILTSTNHRRSSTMQLHELSRRPSQADRLPSDARVPQRSGGRRSPLSISHSPSADSRERTPEFKFPPAAENSQSNTPPLGQYKRPSPDPAKRIPSHQRVASTATSARDSMDIYSGGPGSNHSDETLASEHVSMISERPVQRSRVPSEMIRQHYKMGPGPASAPPRRPQAVTLLMGYAQVGATFTLDASLVDQTPFEEVKRKGYLGGQAGGGVVGVNKKKNRPSSGLFGGFNFASLGESLESIMTGSLQGGNGASSSVKEMKAVSNSRAIPLLSTPQSLLFVDLRLEPGEQRSYSFKYRLPRGLPASYRGKAIKVTYSLTIGVQGAPAAGQKEVSVRQINVPFRVFPGVDPSDGEILGHDLMQPHVILKDLAVTKEISGQVDEVKLNGRSDMTGEEVTKANSQFLNFVDSLLDRNRRRKSSTGSMMEQMIFAQSRMGGLIGGKSPAVQAINRAIMLSNQTSAIMPNSDPDATTSPNRFEITRAGRRVAVVTLDRPLHRLGETVAVVIDFSQSEVLCSSLRMTLETSEKVEAALAVRSSATIARVTRKVYSSRGEIVLFGRRIVFSPTIPVLVSPTFVTSGVGLEWCVKLEFVTVKANQAQEQELSQMPQGIITNNDEDEEEDEDEDGVERDDENTAALASQLKGRGVQRDNQTDMSSINDKPQLLEEILTDERGVIEVAVESLDCDHFEVAIPIIVYGDIVMDVTNSAGDGREDEVVGISI